VPHGTSPTPPAASGKLQQYMVARPNNVEPLGGKVNYVVVYHPIVKKAAAIAQAIPGVQEGQVAVIMADGQILPATKFFLIDARQYWTQMSYDDGEVRAASRDKPAGDSVLEEHIESLVLGFTPKGLVAAKASWRKTRSPFAKAMAAAWRAQDGRWWEFTGTPVVEPRTTKKTGKPYTLLTALISPIDREEAKALQAWDSDAHAQAEIEKMDEAYRERCRSLDSLAK